MFLFSLEKIYRKKLLKFSRGNSELCTGCEEDPLVIVFRTNGDVSDGKKERVSFYKSTFSLSNRRKKIYGSKILK